MPFGLGFFATAGVSAAAGSYELISSTILTGSQASVTFSNLGDYSSTYKHLQIRYVARTAESSDRRAMSLRMNGDTGSNYSYHILEGNGSSVFSYAGSSQNTMYAGQIAASGASANIFGAGIVDILDPFQAKNKTIRSLSSATPTGSSSVLRMFSGAWYNTASLTSITLASEDLSSNFVQYSRFSLYGLRG